MPFLKISEKAVISDPQLRPRELKIHYPKEWQAKLFETAIQFVSSHFQRQQFLN